MTREEIQELLFLFSNSFQNFKVENKTATINSWLFWLEEYEAKEVSMAVKAFVKIEGSAFAPSPSQLMKYLNMPQEIVQMTEGEAWAIVRRAIGKSAYYSEEEFAKLPPECQRAVGSSAQLYSWATDTEFNESVVMSNFERSYRNVIERKKEFDRMPIEMKNRVLELQNQAQKLIGGQQ